MDIDSEYELLKAAFEKEHNVSGLVHDYNNVWMVETPETHPDYLTELPNYINVHYIYPLNENLISICIDIEAPADPIVA